MFNIPNFKNISFVVGVILVIVLGVFLYKSNFFWGINEEGNSNIVNTLNNSGVSITGDATIEQIPVEEKITIPIPDLNRKIVFTATNDSSPEVQKIILNKVTEIVSFLKGNPNSLEKWLELGVWRKGIGDYEGARQAWQYVADVSSNSISAYINLGELYQFQLKDFVLAEKNMLKVVKISPDYISGYHALYNLYTLSYKEKINELPKILLDGLSVNPKSIDLMILLAHYYREVKDNTKAILYYDMAIRELTKEGDSSRLVDIKVERDSLK